MNNDPYTIRIKTQDGFTTYDLRTLTEDQLEELQLTLLELLSRFKSRVAIAELDPNIDEQYLTRLRNVKGYISSCHHRTTLYVARQRRYSNRSEDLLFYRQFYKLAKEVVAPDTYTRLTAQAYEFAKQHKARPVEHNESLSSST